MIGKKKGYDEFAYDAIIGILAGIASWKYGAERLEKKYREILIGKGQKTGDTYYAIKPVKKIRSDFEPNAKGTVVQLPSFDEFIEKHGDYLKLMLLEEILSKSPKIIPKDEEKKIEKTIDIAIDAAKKLAETYGDPENLVHVGLMKIKHAKDALSVLEFLNPEKHPLDVIGDHIIELKKMHPEVVKPEKVYGKEWYEFLKKKGIDPDELNPEKKKKKNAGVQKTRESISAEARELLGLLKGLKYARYSDDAVSEAKRELKAKLNELLQRPEENLELIGLYFTVGELIEQGDFERAEELLRMLG
ncbi:hypothetical protein [Thermococcus thermotolerans]|uniref:hypothetical protein n=1 Tax=Thermococcus thermotolerans TaxID=2969672 RepID=UPI0021577B1D|nr:hypothetical protein [Thermococcus thermotolerans]